VYGGRRGRRGSGSSDQLFHGRSSNAHRDTAIVQPATSDSAPLLTDYTRDTDRTSTIAPRLCIYTCNLHKSQYRQVVLNERAAYKPTQRPLSAHFSFDTLRSVCQNGLMTLPRHRLSSAHRCAFGVEPRPSGILWQRVIRPLNSTVLGVSWRHSCLHTTWHNVSKTLEIRIAD